ncbi:MAG TPA: patatin-like phospholipase family protein [Verrucomicrobiae bacterium]|nr:patatin-like phospholipase family protein [Verrucomicrobiae bacterium]
MHGGNHVGRGLGAVLGSLLLAGLACGCAHRRLNFPLTAVDRSAGYYFHPAGRTNQSDEMLVALAFSGGGTRAAAFAYGVLEELHDTRLPGPQPRSLLDEVDVISSVSGGSVTAAAYGLYGDRVFSVLEPAFLKHNVQRSLVLQTLNPLHWPALWSPTYGRSELAADYYDRLLFHGATFATLQTNGSPFLVINGTDITTGTRFDFTQHCFDLICSDVAQYPLASAVAASSAVPGALTPVTLKNFAGACDCALPDWITAARQQEAGRMTRRAQVLTSYLDATNRPFIHLVDGGVSDNLGLQPFLDYVQSIPLSPGRHRELAQLRARKIVLIIVNAYASPDRDWDRRETPPGSLATAAAAASHTLDERSLDTLDYLRDSLRNLKERLELPPDVKIYPVFLSFTNFRDQKQQRFFLNLPTSFFLPGTDVDKLREAGHLLLRQDPTYQELLRDLGTGEPPLAVKP